MHAHGRGFPFPELSVLFAKKSIYTPFNDKLGQKRWTKIIRRVIFSRYEKILCQTEYGRKSLVNEGLDPKKVIVIPMPVDYDYFSKPSGGKGFRKKHNLGNDPFVITVGIRPMKRPDVIAKACELAGMKAVLVGPYTKSDAERAWKGEADWYLPPKEVIENDNVVLTGQLNAREMLAAFDAATIYAHSSLYEGFGIAVYEAASAGIPLCLPDYGTFDSFNGHSLRHKFDNPGQLSSNIKKYLNNPRLRLTNGKLAAQTARKFNYPVVKAMYDDLYKSLNFV